MPLARRTWGELRGHEWQPTRRSTWKPATPSIESAHLTALTSPYPRHPPTPARSYPSVAQGMFARGPVELVHHVMSSATAAMADELDAAVAQLAGMSTTARVRFGVQARLRHFTPYMANGTWAQAMAVALLPQNLPATAALAATAADEIWWHAGDRSTDTTWYTRRLLLLGVMSSTEVFMLTDRSADWADSWAFLDARLADVTRVGRGAGEGLAVAQAVGGGLASLAGAAWDLARPLLGPLPQVALGAVGAAVSQGAAVASAAAGAAAAATGMAMPSASAAAGGSSSTGASPSAASPTGPFSFPPLSGSLSQLPTMAASAAASAAAQLPNLAAQLPNLAAQLPNIAAQLPSFPAGASPLRLAPAPVVDALANAAGAVMRALPLPPLPAVPPLPLPGMTPAPPAAVSPFAHSAPPTTFSHGAPPAAFSHGAPPAAFSHGAPPAAFSHGAPPAAFSHGAPPATFTPASPPATTATGTSPSNAVYTPPPPFPVAPPFDGPEAAAGTPAAAPAGPSA